MRKLLWAYIIFLGYLLSSCSVTLLREAHEKAVAVSAYVCTQRGAMPVLPAELKA